MRRNKIQSKVARASKDIEINLARKHQHRSDHFHLAGDQRESLIQSGQDLPKLGRHKNSSTTTVAAATPTTMPPQQQPSEATNGRQTPAKKSNAADFKNNNSNNQTDSSSPKRSRRGLACLCLVLMGITLFVTAILIAIYSFVLLDNEDKCYNPSSPPFQQIASGYNLFATKTSYSDALRLLAPPQSGGEPKFEAEKAAQPTAPPSRKPKPNYDDLPKIFSQRQEDSLQSIHKSLLSEGCKAVQLHYYGRHAARYPNSNEIERIGHEMAAVQRKLDSPREMAAIELLGARKTPIAEPQAARDGNGGAVSVANNSNICLDPLLPFKQWKFPLIPFHDDLITANGFTETEAIARRFKSIYPSLFNGSATDIQIAVTTKLRTAQTALAFLKHLDNFDNKVCKLIDFPTMGTLGKGHSGDLEDRLKAVREDTCLNAFVSQYMKSDLEFHSECKRQHKRFTIVHKFDLKTERRFQFIAEALSKRLKLSDSAQLSVNETRAIYDTCRYESSYDSKSSSSIWCNLFEESELKFFEYLNDIDDFYNEAYGVTQHFREACPLTTHLLQQLKSSEAIEPEEEEEARRQSPTKPRANFHFTHSSVIQKLIAASVDLNDDSAYLDTTVTESLAKNSVPRQRNWQTSLLTPFSANIAFSLYECPAKEKGRQGKPPARQLDVAKVAGPLRVVASINEQPFVLTGCPGLVCDLSRLDYAGLLAQERTCKFEDICSKIQYIVT